MKTSTHKTVTEFEEGGRSIHYFEDMTPEKRPQDPQKNGRGLKFETLEHGGKYPDTMLQAIRLTDAQGRHCTYVTINEPEPGKRPQDPTMEGKGFKFKTRAHGGEYPDLMPQEIVLTDAKGISCTYVPVKENGKVVDSKGFELQRRNKQVR